MLCSLFISTSGKGGAVCRTGRVKWSPRQHLSSRQPSSLFYYYHPLWITCLNSLLDYSNLLITVLAFYFFFFSQTRCSQLTACPALFSCKLVCFLYASFANVRAKEAQSRQVEEIQDLYGVFAEKDFFISPLQINSQAQKVLAVMVKKGGAALC